MFDPETPHSGIEVRHALSTLLGEGMTWQSPRSDAWFFAPQGAAWSPAFHIRHLRKTSSAILTGLKLPRLVLTLRFGRRSGGSRSYTEMHTLYLAAIAAGAQAGPFTPKEEPAAANLTERRPEILNRWTSVTVEFTNAVADWSEDALDTSQMPHPLLGTLSVREMLFFTVFHTAHHLRRVVERSDAMPG